MRLTVYLAFISIFCTFLAAGPAAARGMAAYDAATMVEVEGRITKISTDYNPNTREEGLHLKIKGSAGVHVIHVSPKWWADKQQFDFKLDEVVTVSGSQFTKDGENNIYAATLKRRFANLAPDKQKRLAAATLTSSDLHGIAEGFGVSVAEVENIKFRIAAAVDSALFPAPLKLRDPQTGDGLWHGRYQDVRSVDRKQQTQGGMRERMRGRMQGGR